MTNIIDSSAKEPVHPGGLTVPEHLQQLYEAAISHCSLNQAQRVAMLQAKYSSVFSTGNNNLGRTVLVQRSIPVLDSMRPICPPPHQLSTEKEAKAEKQIEGFLQQNLIEPSNGAWSSPVVLVKKKDGSWRCCIDYKKLNSITQQDAFPLPWIDRSLDALPWQGASIVVHLTL